MKDLQKFLILITLLIPAGISSVYAQDDGKRRISGTVSDENGEPLTGAYVYIKDTQVGTTTNLDGIYVIDINPDDELTFSFVGYLEQTLKPKAASNTLNVKLQPDALMAEEAVVIAYGAQKREARQLSVNHHHRRHQGHQQQCDLRPPGTSPGTYLGAAFGRARQG